MVIHENLSHLEESVDCYLLLVGIYDANNPVQQVQIQSDAPSNFRGGIKHSEGGVS